MDTPVIIHALSPVAIAGIGIHRLMRAVKCANAEMHGAMRTGAIIAGQADAFGQSDFGGFRKSHSL
jgi:hypothetical protein